MFISTNNRHLHPSGLQNRYTFSSVIYACSSVDRWVLTGEIIIIIIIVRLYSHKRHTATHTWIHGSDKGHTRRPEVVVILVSAFSHPGLSFLQDPRSSGQLLSARGPGEVTRLSWSWTDKECSSLCPPLSVHLLLSTPVSTPLSSPCLISFLPL